MNDEKSSPLSLPWDFTFNFLFPLLNSALKVHLL